MITKQSLKLVLPTPVVVAIAQPFSLNQPKAVPVPAIKR